MGVLSYRTAGESHGKGMLALVEGMPAGVPVDSSFIIETNADAVNNEGLAVSEEAGPSKRVKRWKIGGGGNVFTLQTGEGRVFLRRR